MQILFSNYSFKMSNLFYSESAIELLLIVGENCFMDIVLLSKQQAITLYSFLPTCLPFYLFFSFLSLFIVHSFK